MSKVALIGAGSTIFAQRLIGDILLTPELAKDTQIALHDIEDDRLRTSEIVTRRITEKLGLKTLVFSSTDRREVLAGSDYVIFMMQIGGYKPSTVIDFGNLIFTISAELFEYLLNEIGLSINLSFIFLKSFSPGTEKFKS